MASKGTTVHPTALLYVPVQLRERIVWSLVDSGAADNFISEKTVKRLQLPTQLLDDPMTVCVGNGQLIHATEYVYLTLDLGAFKAKTKLKVLPTPIPMVLGYPFLAKHQPEIDWVKRRLFFLKEGRSLLVQGYSVPQAVPDGDRECSFIPLSELPGVQWTTPMNIPHLQVPVGEILPASENLSLKEIPATAFSLPETEFVVSLEALMA